MKVVYVGGKVIVDNGKGAIITFTPDPISQNGLELSDLLASCQDISINLAAVPDKGARELAKQLGAPNGRYHDVFGGRIAGPWNKNE